MHPYIFYWNYFLCNWSPAYEVLVYTFNLKYISFDYFQQLKHFRFKFRSPSILNWFLYKMIDVHLILFFCKWISIFSSTLPWIGNILPVVYLWVRFFFFFNQVTIARWVYLWQSHISYFSEFCFCTSCMLFLSLNLKGWRKGESPIYCRQEGKLVYPYHTLYGRFLKIFK